MNPFAAKLDCVRGRRCRLSRSRPEKAASAKRRSLCICPFWRPRQAPPPTNRHGPATVVGMVASAAWPEEPRLIEAAARELPDCSQRPVAKGFGRVIVDTPPHAETRFGRNAGGGSRHCPDPAGGRSISRRSPRRSISRSASVKAPLAVINHAPARTGPPSLQSSRKPVPLSNKMGAKVAASVLAKPRGDVSRDPHRLDSQRTRTGREGRR